jgi:hypothetical protein
MKNFDAWLVPYCPDFYFMPSLFYHKVFKEWDNKTWDCPAYWSDRGIPLITCYQTTNREDAKCYISLDQYNKWSKACLVKGYNCTINLWNEDLDCAFCRNKEVIMLTFDDFSNINRQGTTGPKPEFKTKRARDY